METLDDSITDWLGLNSQSPLVLGSPLIGCSEIGESQEEFLKSIFGGSQESFTQSPQNDKIEERKQEVQPVSNSSLISEEDKTKEKDQEKSLNDIEYSENETVEKENADKSEGSSSEKNRSEGEDEAEDEDEDEGEGEVAEDDNEDEDEDDEDEEVRYLRLLQSAEAHEKRSGEKGKKEGNMEIETSRLLRDSDRSKLRSLSKQREDEELIHKAQQTKKTLLEKLKNRQLKKQFSTNEFLKSDSITSNDFNQNYLSKKLRESIAAVNYTIDDELEIIDDPRKVKNNTITKSTKMSKTQWLRQMKIFAASHRSETKAKELGFSSVSEMVIAARQEGMEPEKKDFVDGEDSDHMENKDEEDDDHMENKDDEDSDHMENKDEEEDDHMENKDDEDSDHMENKDDEDSDHMENKDGEHIENESRDCGEVNQDQSEKTNLDDVNFFEYESAINSKANFTSSQAVINDESDKSKQSAYGTTESLICPSFTQTQVRINSTEERDGVNDSTNRKIINPLLKRPAENKKISLPRDQPTISSLFATQNKDKEDKGDKAHIQTPELEPELDKVKPIKTYTRRIQPTVVSNVISLNSSGNLVQNSEIQITEARDLDYNVDTKKQDDAKNENEKIERRGENTQGEKDDIEGSESDSKENEEDEYEIADVHSKNVQRKQKFSDPLIDQQIASFFENEAEEGEEDEEYDEEGKLKTKAKTNTVSGIVTYSTGAKKDEEEEEEEDGVVEGLNLVQDNEFLRGEKKRASDRVMKKIHKKLQEEEEEEEIKKLQETVAGGWRELQRRRKNMNSQRAALTGELDSDQEETDNIAKWSNLRQVNRMKRMFGGDFEDWEMEGNEWLMDLATFDPLYAGCLDEQNSQSESQTLKMKWKSSFQSGNDEEKEAATQMIMARGLQVRNAVRKMQKEGSRLLYEDESTKQVLSKVRKTNISTCSQRSSSEDDIKLDALPLVQSTSFRSSLGISDSNSQPAIKQQSQVSRRFVFTRDDSSRSRDSPHSLQSPILSVTSQESPTMTNLIRKRLNMPFDHSCPPGSHLDKKLRLASDGNTQKSSLSAALTAVLGKNRFGSLSQGSL